MLQGVWWDGDAQWSRIAKNRDMKTGPFAYLFTHLLLSHSFVYLLAYSLIPKFVREII